MHTLMKGALLVAALSLPVTSGAQDVAPLFEAAPAILYETHSGVDGPVFDEYFEMLVEKYAGAEGFGWGVYRENATVAYRITALSAGLESMLEVQQARNESFQEFTEDQTDLSNRAWGTRHVAVYNAAPALSVVPDGFSVADIQALPYNRVTLYNLKWDKAPAFRQALAERSALGREAGIEDFVLTAWTGGIGTQAQTVMVRVTAESRAADAGDNAAARRAARQPYIAEFRRLTGIMNRSAGHIEQHDQCLIATLSFVPSR